jgi:hypothetical protein
MTFKPAFAYCLGLALVWGQVACDAPVKDAGPIPAGQVAEIESQQQAIPVDGTTIGTICTAADCDDGNPCTTDICSGGVCKNTANTAPCTDTDLCTFGGVCSGGKCISQRITCLSDACNTRVCNGTSVCKVTPKTGAACSDNNLCTYGELCDANGACTGGRAVTCQSDQCSTRACNGTATCTVTPNANRACDDGNPCTYNDSCDSAGTCRPGMAIICQDDACNTRACDGSSACKVTPKGAGVACNDANACTFGEACDGSGNCRGGTTVSCVTDPCNTRTCNGTATCKVTPRTGNRCDDGKLCSFDDTCTADGTCAGTEIVCASDETAERSCNGGSTCTVKIKPGVACDDGNPCTQGDVRRSDGSCGGMPYSCALGPCLESSVCDGKGGCKSVSKPDETTCDADKSQCTPHDVCRGGICVPDPRPVKCVERDCNSVACNPTSGNCEYKPTSGEACGVSGCFSAGTCQAGVCSGKPKDCSKLTSACTDGLCDAATGECVAAPKTNGSDCSPGGACASAASCTFGVCELPPAACPAPSSSCKVAACDPGNGHCIEADRPQGAPCDPKNSCISDAVCGAQGACIGTPAANGDPCTAEGGQVGQCVSGTCVANGGVIPPVTGQPAGPDAAAGPVDATAPPVPAAAPQKSGCAVAPGGRGGDPVPWLSLASVVALALALRTRRG